MENNTKRTKQFVALATVISYGINTLASLLTTFIMNFFNENPTQTVTTLINGGTSLLKAAFSLIAVFIVGKVLTNNKRKAIIFTGTIFFAQSLMSHVNSLFSGILKNISMLLSGSVSNIATVIFIISILLAIPSGFIAYFLYSALEGTNKKFSGSIATTQLTLSQARKRYVIYAIVGGILSGIIISVPNFLLVLFNNTENYYSFGASLATSLITTIGNALSLLFIYLAGYTAFRSHIDATAICACSSFASKAASVITVPVGILQSVFLNNISSYYITNHTARIIIPVIISAVTLISSIISFVFMLVLLKHFFPAEIAPVFTGYEDVAYETAADYSESAATENASLSEASFSEEAVPEIE